MTHTLKSKEQKCVSRGLCHVIQALALNSRDANARLIVTGLIFVKIQRYRAELAEALEAAGHATPKRRQSNIHRLKGVPLYAEYSQVYSPSMICVLCAYPLSYLTLLSDFRVSCHQKQHICRARLFLFPSSYPAFVRPNIS